jgi:hypothetical protein
MVIFRSLVMIATLAAFLCLGMACSGKESSSTVTGRTDESQPAAESKEEQPVAATQEKLPGVQPQQAESAPPASMPKTLALTGTVAQEGDDIMLVTDLGDYVIAGQDLSSMVGKSVNVTGAVEEADGKYTINVHSFSEN